MNHLSVIQKARRRKMVHIATRAAVAILREPMAVMAIGGLLILVGLYTAESKAAGMAVFGAAALVLGIFAYRKNARKQRGRPKDRRSLKRRKKILVTIVLGGMFLAAGLSLMVTSSPVPTSITLLGALIAGIGFMQFRIQRTKTQIRIRR